MSNTQYSISMTGLVASTDGKRVVRATAEGVDPVLLGTQLAQQVLAQGAGELLP
jgi:hydroxymethylbilane synthase